MIGLENRTNLELTHPKLHKFLEDSELYYGFTNQEMIKFIDSLNKLGYVCDVFSKNEKITFNQNQEKVNNEINLYIGFNPINIKPITN
jgi:hypothetical protein